jgi:hypothetical protein
LAIPTLSQLNIWNQYPPSYSSQLHYFSKLVFPYFKLKIWCLWLYSLPIHHIQSSTLKDLSFLPLPFYLPNHLV